MKNLTAKSICRNGLVVLFVLYAFGNISFGFNNTYNHNITIRKRPSLSEATDKMLQRRHEQNLQTQQLQYQQDMQYQQQMFQILQERERFQQQEHLERLRNDPEYAKRVALNKKGGVLSRQYNELEEYAGRLNQKEKNLFDIKDALLDDMLELQKRAEQIAVRLKTSSEKAKTMLDNPKLLSQEKIELKEMITKQEALSNKAIPLYNKIEAREKQIDNLYENFQKSIAGLINIIQKSSDEADKYRHKIEYDNVAYGAFLQELEKQVEVAPQIIKKKESYIIELEKLIEAYEQDAQEMEKFFEEVIKHKSFARKYERLIKKIEKRLAKLGK
ncbi:hypothetical protein [Helicobacter sp. T3_23-1059]